jgi:hypothetical protein
MNFSGLYNTESLFLHLEGFDTSNLVLYLLCSNAAYDYL